MVNMPYVVMFGGYFAVVMTVVVGIIASLAYHQLKQCIHRFDDTKPEEKPKTRRTMEEIASEAMGPNVGVFLVKMLKFFMLMSQSVFQLMVCGEATSYLFILFVPVQISKTYVYIAYCALGLLPTMVSSKAINVHKYNYINAAASSVFYVVVVVYCATRWHHWRVTDITFFTTTSYTSIALGMILFGFELPLFAMDIIEGKGHETNIDSVVYGNIVSATLVKIVVGLAGALTWGTYVKILITNNIEMSVLVTICNAFLVVKSILTLHYPYKSMIQIAEGSTICAFLSNSRFTCVIGPVCRVILAALIIGSLLLFHDIILFTSLIGITVATKAIILLPSFCHLRLKWREITIYWKILDIIICALAILIYAGGMFMYLQVLFRNK